MCRRMFILLLLFSTLIYNQVSWASAPNLVDLLELSLEDLLLITIATRTSRTRADIPATVYVYNQNDIRDHGWASLADLVQHIPGVDVINKFRGVTLSTRGVPDLNFHGSKTVIMIDGHNTAFSSLSAAGFGGFSSQYDLLNAKRVEVLVGPGGTLHGANAFGMVINIITKEPGDINGIEFDAFYGSQGEFITSARAGKQDGRLGWFQSVTNWRQWDSDLAEVAISKNTSGTEVVYDNSLFDPQTTKNFDLHGYINFAKQARLGYRLARIDSTRGTSLVSTDAGQVVVDQSMVYFDANYQLSDRLKYVLKSHYKETEGDENHSYFVDTVRNLVGVVDVDSKSFVIDNQFTFEQSDRVTWVGGLYYEYSRQRPAAIRLVPGTTDPANRQIPTALDEEIFDNYAIYLESEWYATDDLYMIAGLRFIDSKSQYDSESLPRFGLRYKLTPDWSAKFNYQRGYRPPNVDEGMQRGTIAPNPNIRSEVIDNYEASLEGMLSPHTKFRATYFYSDIKDLIGRTPFSGGGGFASIESNIDSVNVHGAELELDHRFNPRLSLNTVFTFTQSEDDNTGEDQRTIIPYKLNLSARYQPSSNWHVVWDNYLRWNPTTDSSNALFAGEDSDDWVLSNLTINWKQPFQVKNMSATFSIRNLFDDKYGHVDTRVTSGPATPFITSYHPQEERNYLIGLSFQW